MKSRFFALALISLSSIPAHANISVSIAIAEDATHIKITRPTLVMVSPGMISVPEFPNCDSGKDAANDVNSCGMMKSVSAPMQPALRFVVVYKSKLEGASGMLSGCTGNPEQPNEGCQNTYVVYRTKDLLLSQLPDQFAQAFLDHSLTMSVSSATLKKVFPLKRTSSEEVCSPAGYKFFNDTMVADSDAGMNCYSRKDSSTARNKIIRVSLGISAANRIGTGI